MTKVGLEQKKTESIGRNWLLEVKKKHSNFAKKMQDQTKFVLLKFSYSLLHLRERQNKKLPLYLFAV
jgi:hypothetical protein